jgi:hypothetical protein
MTVPTQFEVAIIHHFFMCIVYNSLTEHSQVELDCLVQQEYTPPHKRETFYPFCGNRLDTILECQEERR